MLAWNPFSYNNNKRIRDGRRLARYDVIFVLSPNGEDTFNKCSCPDPDCDPDQLTGGPRHGYTPSCVKRIDRQTNKQRNRHVCKPTLSPATFLGFSPFMMHTASITNLTPSGGRCMARTSTTSLRLSDFKLARAVSYRGDIERRLLILFKRHTCLLNTMDRDFCDNRIF